VSRVVFSDSWQAPPRHIFGVSGRPAIAGISGGSTSGMMAALAGKGVALAFQNTGREHRRTYEFLGELADLIERPITWIEYRPPKAKGDPPGKSRLEIVDFNSADRSGAPFELLLDAIAAYRKTLGKGPIAPWWRSRICTTYLKTRLARAWMESRGESTWDELVGLRADEPDRVAKLRVGVPRRIGRRAPLAEAGITLADVTAFFDRQPIKLGLSPHLGNCDGCFLKNQADLSRALVETGTAELWQRWAEKFPGFGGKNFAGYALLAAEAPLRLLIEAAIRAGVAPENNGSMDARRFKLVVIQERKRVVGELPAFSCACEGSDEMSDMDAEDLDQLIGAV
jgi:3'-phosphoadenosine 5'-phosphosulfate sulfotransferase (PAPS reductase)/FAD synthetase